LDHVEGLDFWEVKVHEVRGQEARSADVGAGRKNKKTAIGAEGADS
jgi:hypothetical protein